MTATSRTQLRKRPLPQWMITYWCPLCHMDSGRTEIDGPYCFFCGRRDDLIELAREPMSPEAISKRLQIAADRMMENLRAAHDMDTDHQNEEEELLLLEALATGKDLQEEVRKWGKERTDQ